MGLFTDKYGEISPMKLGFIGLMVGGTLIIGGRGIANNWKYSEGDSVGMINKISQKGAFWKTYEGQMALEGISGKGESLSANVWDFSIDNNLSEDKKKELSDKVQTYMNSGQKVKIHYVEMLKTLPWRSESNHLIQNIEPVVVAGVRRQESSISELSTGKYSVSSNEVFLDGRHYFLKHDANGKLKVTELKEVQ